MRCGPGWHGRGGLEDASSSSKTTCVIQRDANEWREAIVILRSGSESHADRSWRNLDRAVLSESKRTSPPRGGRREYCPPVYISQSLQGVNTRESCVYSWRRRVRTRTRHRQFALQSGRPEKCREMHPRRSCNFGRLADVFLKIGHFEIPSAP